MRANLCCGVLLSVALLAAAGVVAPASAQGVHILMVDGVAVDEATVENLAKARTNIERLLHEARDAIWAGNCRKLSVRRERLLEILKNPHDPFWRNIEGAPNTQLEALRDSLTLSTEQLFNATRPPQQHIQVTASGNATGMSVPQVSGGTVITPGGEKPISNSSSRLKGGGMSLELWKEIDPRGFRIWKTINRLRFYVSGSYTTADGSSSGAVPAGGDGVAQTYIVPNPDGGSTGVNAGATGQSVTTDTDVKSYDLSTGFRFYFTPTFMGSSVGGDPVIMTPNVDIGLTYRNLTRKDNIRQQSLTFDDLNSAIDLDTSSNFVGPNFGVGIGLMPTGPSGFFANLHGSVAPGVLWTDASAMQHSQCGPCGGGSPEFDVNLQRDFSDTTFSVIAGASAEIGYQISPSAKISVVGSYEYMSRVAVLDVPITPTEQPINLNYGSAESWQIKARLTWQFGAATPPGR
jgi:hypothetical protein